MPIAEFAATLEVDFIEELRLRSWARENYCYPEARQASWHPVIHDEMRRRDADEALADSESVLVDDERDVTVDDSTILTDDSPGTTTRDKSGSLVRMAPLMGPIVPLAPDLPERHGPHEINPPHSRVGAPVEAAEMYYN